MLAQRIDVHEPVMELCARLGMPPEVTQQITWCVDEAEVTVFRRRERDGSFFVDQHGNVATDVHRFKIRT